MKTFKIFLDWYERNYKLNTGIIAGLFVLQFIHLYWLAADVIALRLIGKSFFDLSGIWLYVIIIIDYTEIPILIAVSLLYINELRKGFNWKSVLFLILLNSQWLHIFWITDEIVIGSFTGAGGLTILPIWLAWAAIIIDYLEAPVIFDIVKKFIVSMKNSVKINT